jgi:GNAT superfamily N-acetyltransferase
MISVRKIDAEQLKNLEIASGFTRWFNTKDDKSKQELKDLLNLRILDGDEVWVALKGKIITGFMIVTDWSALPSAKVIDAIEIAEPYRDRGIGSQLLNAFIKTHQEIVCGLLLYPEKGYEKKLEKFYKSLGFELLSENVMVRFPASPEKFQVLAKYLRDLLDLYNKMLKAIESKT